MNYLQLVTRFHSECEAAGSGPSATAGQSGENLREVNWVSQAYTQLQEGHNDWRWLRSTWTVNATVGDDTYAGTDCTDSRLSTAVTRFSHWWPWSESGQLNVKRYLASAGVGTEGYLIFLPWADFRAKYKLGTQNNGFPSHFTIDPQNNLVIGPKPDDTYVLSGEYQMSPQTLAADSDTPEMPTQYHMVIVYEALKRYGVSKGATEVFNVGEYFGKGPLRSLEQNQRPAMQIDGPLA